MSLRKGVCSLAVLLLVAANVYADVTITQLANDGVVVSDGQTRVMIDGMVVEPYSVYGGLPETAAEQYAQATGAWADIDLALVSHRHHDHNQPSYACQFMKKSQDTLLVTSSQVVDLMREKCREFATTSPRIRVIDPQYDAPVVVEENNVKVTIFLLTHGTGKYQRLQHYGQLLEIGGLTVLHIGDAAMTPEDYRKAGLDQIKLDVALIPFWYFQPGPGAALVNQFLDAQVKIALHIPPGEMDEVKPYMTENFPAVTILGQPLEQMQISSAEP